MNSKNSNKLQIKDYINIGIFSAILMVLYLVAAMTNVTPITYLIYSPATAFVGAIPYLFITTKIPKRGLFCFSQLFHSFIFCCLQERKA